MIRHTVSVAALLACAASALALPNYNGFEVQVRSGATTAFNIPPLYSISNSPPIINNNGDVALRVFSPGSMSVWFGNAQHGGIVYQTADTEAIISNLDLSNSGLIVWSETFGNNAPGVWQYSPVTGASYRTNRPLGTSAWTALEIDDDANIALRASFSGSYAFATVDTNNQSTFYAEANGIDPSSPWDFLFTPSFNNSQQIAAKLQLVSGGNEIRVFEADGSSTLIASDTGAVPSSPYTGFRNSGDLADDGRFAFVANLATGGTGVFVSDGTTTIEIARTTTEPDLDSIESFAPRINNNGVVAFRGFDGSGKRAVFVGDGTELIKLVTEGDQVETDLGMLTIGRLDGSPAFGSAPDINDDGMVVFSASVNDGITDIGTAITVATVSDEPDCPGDVTGDGETDLADLNLVLANFGQTTSEGDTNNDGVVDLADLNAVLAAFGTGCD
ncbi:MAG: choice-of-anchor tandem repeat NxxGxxAF-containing protein [Phycisphaerales bacterium JB065]